MPDIERFTGSACWSLEERCRLRRHQNRMQPRRARLRTKARITRAIVREDTLSSTWGSSNKVAKSRKTKRWRQTQDHFTGCSSGLLVLEVWSGKTMPSSPISKLGRWTGEPTHPLTHSRLEAHCYYQFSAMCLGKLVVFKARPKSVIVRNHDCVQIPPKPNCHSCVTSSQNS